MRKAILFSLALSLINFSAFSERIFTQADMPNDYQYDVDGGKKTFVVLLPDDCHSCNRNEEMRKIYPRSGLYLKKSKKLIWEIDKDRSAFDFLDLDEKGRFLVHLNNNAQVSELDSNGAPSGKSLEQLAVAFYENGKVIKKYLIRDLVKDTKNLKIAGEAFYWHGPITHNSWKKRLIILTLDWEQYTFDMTNGNIIYQGNPLLKETR